MDQEQLPPLPKPLDQIAANLAHEGVPIMAIARALQAPFSDVRETLEYFIEIGGITEMPKTDWPPNSRRSDRSPLWLAKAPEADQLFYVQRALKLTKLMASFMLVLLKRDNADKFTLHYVIESQRSIRRSRPDDPETTDPKMVDVVICNLRKRLKPLGIKIETLWGHGYFLSEASREKIEALLSEQQAQDTPKP